MELNILPKEVQEDNTKVLYKLRKKSLTKCSLEDYPKVETIKKFDEEFKEAVKNIKFSDIQNYMASKKWSWWYTEGKTPSVIEITNCVTNLYNSALKMILFDNTDIAYCDSGGFFVLLEYYDNVAYVEIMFNIN